MSINQEQLVVVDLAAISSLTSTSGGIINDVFSDYPTNSPDWANVSATFAEYRVLGMSVTFTPNVTGATVSTLTYAPLFIALDLTSSVTAIASYVAAANYAINRMKPINSSLRLSHLMDGSEEGQFVPTSSAVVDYSFKLFAAGLSNSTSYGLITLRWKCQFRGRI